VPLGAYALTKLSKLGGPAFVNVSRLGHLVESALAPFLPSAELLVESPEPYGTGGTLLQLRERLDGPVVTHNADSLTDVSIEAAIRAHIRGERAATIVTRQVTEHADVVVAQGAAVRFIDRRTESVAGDQWLGIAVFERAALDLLDSEGPSDLATGLLARLIDDDEVTVHRHTGYFLDVGTIDRYVTASIDLLEGRLAALGDPKRGTAFVAPTATVAAGSLGYGAVVLDGAVVPGSSFIERAIVWPNEVVPSGTQVSDGVWALGALQR
jgi:NDP-sugar pyrophosphorylase family protein